MKYINFSNLGNDDMASMALPSGHAASTRESWYSTCLTNVISCCGSMPERLNLS